MIASAATASDTTSGNACPVGEEHGEPVRDPSTSGLAEDARMLDAAVRMLSNSFRAIRSFQAGSYRKARNHRAELVGNDIVSYVSVSVLYFLSPGSMKRIPSKSRNKRHGFRGRYTTRCYSWNSRDGKMQPPP